MKLHQNLDFNTTENDKIYLANHGLYIYMSNLSYMIHKLHPTIFDPKYLWITEFIINNLSYWKHLFGGTIEGGFI